MPQPLPLQHAPPMLQPLPCSPLRSSPLFSSPLPPSPLHLRPLLPAPLPSSSSLSSAHLLSAHGIVCNVLGKRHCRVRAERKGVTSTPTPYGHSHVVLLEFMPLLGRGIPHVKEPIVKAHVGLVTWPRGRGKRQNRSHYAPPLPPGRRWRLEQRILCSNTWPGGSSLGRQGWRCR